MTSLQGGYDRYQRVDGFFAVNGGDGDEVSVVKENNHGKISSIIYKQSQIHNTRGDQSTSVLLQYL